MNLLRAKSPAVSVRPAAVRMDRDNEEGMATTIGRLRRDHALENGWKYLLVSHNTKMGAAKGCLLVAEYLAHKNFIS